MNKISVEKNGKGNIITLEIIIIKKNVFYLYVK